MALSEKSVVARGRFFAGNMSANDLSERQLPFTLRALSCGIYAAASKTCSERPCALNVTRVANAATSTIYFRQLQQQQQQQQEPHAIMLSVDFLISSGGSAFATAVTLGDPAALADLTTELRLSLENPGLYALAEQSSLSNMGLLSTEALLGLVLSAIIIPLACMCCGGCGANRATLHAGKRHIRVPPRPAAVDVHAASVAAEPSPQHGSSPVTAGSAALLLRASTTPEDTEVDILSAEMWKIQMQFYAASEAAMEPSPQRGSPLFAASSAAPQPLAQSKEGAIVEANFMLLCCQSDWARAGVLLGAYPTLVSASDGQGDSPLHHAAALGAVQFMALLLAAGASVFARNARGIDALCVAARAGQTGAIDALLAAGADIGGADAAGDTPLHHAALGGSAAAVAALLAAGADAGARDSLGLLPWQVATGPAANLL